MTRRRPYTELETMLLERGYRSSANKRKLIEITPDEALDRYLFKGIKEALANPRLREES